jgi:hypothetical protein
MPEDDRDAGVMPAGADEPVAGPERGQEAPMPRRPRRALVLAGRRWPGGVAGCAGLVRRHWLLAVLLGLAVVPRVVAMAGFGPAALFKLDTYDYLWDAVRLVPNPVNPSGYAVFLWVLWPFHSLVLVAAVQHVMGLGIAVMVYVVLRRRGVAGWVAAVAVVPVLFDPAQLLIEQLVMADIVAMFLMVAGFAVLLVVRVPSWRRAAVAAALMGASAVVRPTALPLIVVLVVYLLVIRSGWRAAAAALAAGLLPVAGYVAWFAASTGSVGLTSSDGLFLWSRTMSFASCAVIRPPADLAALCPGRQPNSLYHPTASRRLPPRVYLWNHHAWQWQPPVPGIVPDTAAFTPANNARARDFAIRAIEAQPLGYAKVVAAGVIKPFLRSDQLHFPGPHPAPIFISKADRRYMLAAVRGYLGTTAGIAPYLSVYTATRLQEPWAGLISRYQDHIHLPGPLFGLILLAGLAGGLIRRTRSAAGLLTWTSAAVLIVVPVAAHEYTYRYMIPAVPLAFLAAALAARNREQDGGPGADASATRSAESSAASSDRAVEIPG